MKNSELIEKLQKLDPDLPVYLSYHYGVNMRAEEITGVNVLEVYYSNFTHFSRVEPGGDDAIVLENI